LQKTLAVGAGRPKRNFATDGEITDSWQQAAQTAGTSRGAMSQLKFVSKHADRELMTKLRKGTVRLSSAYKMLRQGAPTGK